LYYGAIVHAGTAAGAQVGIDGPGALADFNLEFARFALNGFQIRISDQFDVQMPADLDQYR
jgi:hypothetical protein